MTANAGLGFSGIVAIQIPDDGATGEVLTKLTAADYDYDWQPGGGGGGAPTDAEYVVLSLNATLTDERVLTAGAGLTLTDGGAGGNVTLDVGAGTGIIVNANDVQLDLASNLNVDHSTVVLTAGAGMTGGGDITASRTFDVIANVDGSIVVNADDIQVGVLATDAQHGNRGGGALHALAVSGVAAGFISGADQQKLDNLITNAVPDTRTLTAGAGLTGGGDLTADRTFDVGAGTGIVVNADDVQLDLASNLNVDHSGVVLTAGAGLTGGGDITASRTFDVGAGSGITVNADDIEIDTTFLDGLYVTLGAPAQTITTVKTFNPFGTGVIGQNDIIIGDAVTPDYGLAQIGDSVFGRTNFNAAALDLDGSVLTFNQTLPATSNIEFAWVDGVPNIRFALAVPGVGNATYNPRSMLIAGPAVLDDTVVTVGYWQTNNNIFDNLVCDTVGQGADLGVQNDLEVEGIIYTDNIQESTPAAAVTLTADEGTGSGSIAWQGDDLVWSPASSPASSYVIGYGATGDPTTPFANRINLSGLSGFNFIMSNAAFPQFIIGNTDPTSAVFIDGNGNKVIRINTLDTGFDQDNAVFFGYGGINLQDQAGDATFIRSAAVVAGTYTITLPDSPGSAGQILVNQDGAATLDWEDPAVTGIYPVWAEENAALAAGAFEWAFGNGANTPIDGGLTVHVPPGYTCEVFAMSLRIGSGTATVQLYLNGVAQGPNGQVAVAAGQGASTTLGTPIAVVDGDFINFQTVAAAGTSAPNVVTAWLRVFPT